MTTTRTRRLPALVFLPFCVGCVGACAGDVAPGAPAASVTDSAGVRIVENPAPDRPAAWQAVAIADLVPPDSALTVLPWAVEADPAAGRIYAVDGTSERVVVFDRSGGYVGTYGRRGAGPGEFRNPAALSVGPDGVLTVWDAGRGVLSRWSAEGELLDERPAPLPYWGPGFHEADGRILTVTSRTAEREQRQMLVALAADDTVVLHTVSRELVMMELPCMSAPAPRLFAPDIVWTASGGTTYVLNGPDYRIDVYADGALTASIRRAVEPIRVTARMAAARVAFGQFAAFLRRCGVTADQLVAAVGHEELTPVVQWLAVDPDGRLWVTRSADGITPRHVDILDADGRYLGTLDAPGMPLAFVSPTVFAALTIRPETRETVLTLYELRARDGTGN